MPEAGKKITIEENAAAIDLDAAHEAHRVLGKVLRDFAFTAPEAFVMRQREAADLLNTIAVALNLVQPKKPLRVDTDREDSAALAAAASAKMLAMKSETGPDGKLRPEVTDDLSPEQIAANKAALEKRIAELEQSAKARAAERSAIPVPPDEGEEEESDDDFDDGPVDEDAVLDEDEIDVE